MACYLDADTTGEEITVYVLTNPIGQALTDCAPLLRDGTPIMVVEIDGVWYSNQTIDLAVESDIYTA